MNSRLLCSLAHVLSFKSISLSILFHLFNSNWTFRAVWILNFQLLGIALTLWNCNMIIYIWQEKKVQHNPFKVFLCLDFNLSYQPDLSCKSLDIHTLSGPVGIISYSSVCPFCWHLSTHWIVPYSSTGLPLKQTPRHHGEKLGYVTRMCMWYPRHLKRKSLKGI